MSLCTPIVAAELPGVGAVRGSVVRLCWGSLKELSKGLRPRGGGREGRASPPIEARRSAGDTRGRSFSIAC